MNAYAVELIGILIALGLLIVLAFRGFTLLLAAPAAAIVAAAFSGEPLLANWTLTFMEGFCSVAYSASSWMIAERRYPLPAA